MKLLLTILFIAGMCSAQYRECFWVTGGLVKNSFDRPMFLVSFGSDGYLFCNLSTKR